MVEKTSVALMPFETSGPEKGKPIVLLPGGLSGWISWKPHAEILSKDFRVVRVQLLNMDAAEKKRSPGTGYSLRKESEALKNTLNKIGLREVNIVGWSHGGGVSLDFALNNPDHIKTLTLIEPAAYWVARAHGKFEEEERELRELFNGFQDPPTEEDVISFLRTNGLIPPGVDPRTMPRWPVWSSLRTALSSLHTVVEHTDDPARLRLLRDKPVLLVKGKDSVGGNSDIVDLLSSDLGPKSRVITLPDAHACHIVAQDQFLAELKQFIGSAK